MNGHLGYRIRLDDPDLRLGAGFLLGAAGVGLLCSGAPVSADVAYETKIVGTDDPDLSDLFDDVSQLKKLEDKKPVSEEALRRRAHDDLERLKEAAHSLKGAAANLVVIDPEAIWVVEPVRLASRSRNTPYAGRKLTGRVRHTLLRGEPVVVDAEAQR